MPARGEARIRTTLSIARRSRVVVDDDWAGDPDGLVALAHHLLLPGNVVEAVTSSLLSPQFGPPAGGSARGAALAEELVALVGGGAAPAVHAGGDDTCDPARPPSEVARAIVRAARREDPLPLVVVCAGPLTNVAEALHHDPGIADRMTLSRVGGSSTERPECNRDTDRAAAAHVFGAAGLERWQFPLETCTAPARGASPRSRTRSRAVDGSVRGCGEGSSSSRSRTASRSTPCGRSETAARSSGRRCRRSPARGSTNRTGCAPARGSTVSRCSAT
ncbi:nucleoside hydrolase [Kineococcus esterisolvens]|uniref:nucleoside hydrolase n=1 Tax=unclassified Kineococcus TaxID=2621656 RepID=UPI003D7D781C